MHLVLVGSEVIKMNHIKMIASRRVNRGDRHDFKINFTGSFLYINNEGIFECTLNSYKEYININLC